MNRSLESLGFRFEHQDDEYKRYLKLRSELFHERFESRKTDDILEGVNRLSREEREQIAREVVADVLSESDEEAD